MAIEPKEWVSRTKEFWREIKAEMKKVSWPSRHEVVGTTGVVLVAVIAIGFYLWVCDLAFFKAINFIFTRFGASA
jgi:preprotein translocase subunit SecE